MTAMMIPTITYNNAIFQPKKLASSKTEARSTSGEEIKNENVTPTGKPALVKPINIGIDEQLQNGVNVPRSAPKTCDPKP